MFQVLMVTVIFMILLYFAYYPICIFSRISGRNQCKVTNADSKGWYLLLGIMVITLYEIGKILEARAVSKTRKSITDLMDIKPEYANLKIGEDLELEEKHKRGERNRELQAVRFKINIM